MSQTSCCGFIVTNLIQYILLILIEGSQMLAAVALLTWTKQFLFLAIIVGVLLFTLMQVYLFPILCSRFERVKTELPDENDDLKQ